MSSTVAESQEPIYIEKVTTDSDGRMASGFGEERKTQRGTKTDSFLDTARGCHLYTIACCHHWPDTFIFHPKHWHAQGMKDNPYH